MTAAAHEHPKRSRRAAIRARAEALPWRWIAVGAGVVAVAAALVAWRASGRVSTDDARIDGHVALIAAQVAGPVAAVHVEENQHVAKGDVLVELDDARLRAAADRARADVARAQAALDAAQASVPLTEASSASTVSTAEAERRRAASGVTAATDEAASEERKLDAARAHLREKQAAAEDADRNLARFEQLLGKDEVSRQQRDTAATAAAAARAAADAADADVRAAESDVAAARGRTGQARDVLTRTEAEEQAASAAPRAVERTHALAAQAKAELDLAQAALRTAELDLEHAKILAPSDGIAGKRMVEVGQVVAPGQPLVAIVADETPWVTANFKETDLERMREGQRAVVEVDALGGARIEGRVESIAPAAAATFSLFPGENASGNFIKVVQRVPVRIAFEKADAATLARLRVGMNVTPTVFLR